MIRMGKSPARANLKARILLKTDQGPEGCGWTDRQICAVLDTNNAMVGQVREKCVTHGIDASTPFSAANSARRLQSPRFLMARPRRGL